jgi:hypothetical protein
MRDSSLIANVCFRPSTDAVARSGRLGTVAFDLSDLHLDGVQLRRSSTGRIYLSFRYAQVRPDSHKVRVALEVAVITLLRLRPETAPP